MVADVYTHIYRKRGRGREGVEFGAFSSSCSVASSNHVDAGAHAATAFDNYRYDQITLMSVVTT